jgi:hypothetical protein
VRAGARQAKLGKDAGVMPCSQQGEPRGRRSSAGMARHPGVRGWGKGHRRYQTFATSSPPTPARRASWPVMTPRDVDTIVVPMPPWTFGTAPA